MTEDFGHPMNFPSLLGVYLAANAVPDAYVLVDGPDCALYKAHFIHGRHDWNSTLLSVTGRHRVAFTNVCARGVVKEHDDLLIRNIRMLDGLEESGIVLVTALPLCSITGVDYGRIIHGQTGRLKKPAVAIPPGSLAGDWLDGYGQTLCALAGGLELGASRKRPRSAAIVGYLMDRNEADHLANLEEIRRMLKALSLEPISIWLGGEPAASLRRAGEAEWIVSLPYGRRAARLIAEKTGARLIEAELPFGLPKTADFLRRLGRAVGRPERAEAFIEREMRRVVPRIEWVLPHLFLNRRVAFVGDPHLLGGFLDVAEDAGMRVAGAVVTGRSAHGGARAGLSVLHEPSQGSEEVRRLFEAGLDLIVSHGLAAGGLGWDGVPLMEFGFPSYSHHAFFDRPFLGYNGFLAFLERMAEHLARGAARG